MTPLPDGGLTRGALHEIAGAGPDIEYAAAAAPAGRRDRRQALEWNIGRENPLGDRASGSFCASPWPASGCTPTGSSTPRAGHPKTVLLVMEGSPAPIAGLAAVIGEFFRPLRPDQFRVACNSRRKQTGGDLFLPCAAAAHHGRSPPRPNRPPPMTRWRVGRRAGPRRPCRIPRAPQGLSRPRWRLELLRCRGGEPANWIVGGLRCAGSVLALAADLAHRSPAQIQVRHAAAR